MFEVTARLKIRGGELEGFKRQAAEVMRLARQKDTKTLRYDWFIADDGVQCEVREGYVDADGLLEHNENVKDARNKLFREHAYDHDMSIYGEPSPALAELFERMAGHGHLKFSRYALLQGLDSDIRVSDRDPGVEVAEMSAVSGEIEHQERGMTMFEATAKLAIREGELEGFKEQAAEVMRQLKEYGGTPLRYDWFLSADGTECEVREAYEDADSLLAHQQLVAAAKMRLMREFVTRHTMSFYDEPSPELAHALETLGATYKQFSFLQGLDAESRVPEEITA